MNEQQKQGWTKAAVVLVATIALAGGLWLGYNYVLERLNKSEQEGMTPQQQAGTPMSVFTGMAEKSFDNVYFVRALDVAADKWRTGSKFQMRGAVMGYADGVVRIKVGEGNIIPVALNSPELRVKCTAVTMTGPDGQPMAASQAVVDYPEPEKIGKLATAAQIQAVFPEHADMMVIANRDNEQLVGMLVVGYGCRL